jgi:hypothetical protein
MVLNACCFSDRNVYSVIWNIIMGDALAVIPYSGCVIIFIIVLWNEWKE